MHIANLCLYRGSVPDFSNMSAVPETLDDDVMDPRHFIY